MTASEPYYVVETSGYKIAAHGQMSTRGLEHELAVVGPAGVHMWHHVVSRDRGAPHLPGRRGAVRYLDALAHYRAAAASVCALLNEEANAS